MTDAAPARLRRLGRTGHASDPRHAVAWRLAPATATWADVAAVTAELAALDVRATKTPCVSASLWARNMVASPALLLPGAAANAAYVESFLARVRAAAAVGEPVVLDVDEADGRRRLLLYMTAALLGLRYERRQRSDESTRVARACYEYHPDNRGLPPREMLPLCGCRHAPALFRRHAEEPEGAETSTLWADMPWTEKLGVRVFVPPGAWARRRGLLALRARSRAPG
jgi:hypothetical protein